MFIAASYTIAKKWKQPNCSSIDGRINKMWCIHAVEYFQLQNEILICATLWMSLEIILNEKKPDIKAYILYKSIYMKCLK